MKTAFGFPEAVFFAQISVKRCADEEADLNKNERHP